MRRVCPRGHETLDDRRTTCQYCSDMLPPVLDPAVTTLSPRIEVPDTKSDVTQRVEPPPDNELPVGHADVILGGPGEDQQGKMEWLDGLSIVLPHSVPRPPQAGTVTVPALLETSASLPEPTRRRFDITLRFPPATPPPLEEQRAPRRPVRALVAVAAAILLVGFVLGYLLGHAGSPTAPPPDTRPSLTAPPVTVTAPPVTVTAPPPSPRSPAPTTTTRRSNTASR